jgi:hypothetical protein
MGTAISLEKMKPVTGVHNDALDINGLHLKEQIKNKV